ncbi:Integrase [Vibrio crassostreae]|nr:site-specific recombinase XerD [Vibrio crassostreae]TCT83356.1 site-specific recombinase XerD [Vibrio crassostreae]TCU03767.1 site-specific recombinase XerD [Vibrio crassostreae]TDW09507.1 site-specific recombinase XerD [Vibrio crassostreae]CAK2048390.1 Integrase [Vibrio crassostreae]
MLIFEIIPVYTTDYKAGNMAKTDTKHLKLRGNVWWYQRRIPIELLDQFNGQKTLFESLDTGDIREARRKRNIINGRLEERRFNAPNKDRHRFFELLKVMSDNRQSRPDCWDTEYDLDKLENDKVFVQAYMTANGSKDFRREYGMTLKEALNAWVRKFREHKTADTVSKVQKVVDSFLKHIKLYDIRLADITKKQVHDYIEAQQLKYAKTTVQGQISRMRSVWNYCDSIDEVSTKCPFDGHTYTSTTTTNKKQPFTVQDMQWIKQNVAKNEPNHRLLVELGVFTGCRISELCGLRVKDVTQQGRITAIFIEKGKTSSATRTIPLTDALGKRVQALTKGKSDDELLLGFENSSEMSRWFSRIKTENISNDSAKCFHSFRVMFATAMQQAGIDELKAAAILGHKRGNTMSYGYYSRGYDLKQLKEAYDQCVKRIIW